MSWIPFRSCLYNTIKIVKSTNKNSIKIKNNDNIKYIFAENKYIKGIVTIGYIRKFTNKLLIINLLNWISVLSSLTILIFVTIFQIVCQPAKNGTNIY